ncbi:RPM1-interacting protein 4-like [Melia azedarach]|uniref:RPM1-interacting protein 4-like n=1 Tax=Melia azedarach TaxID=155640 RepID=A0ACC1XM68_MELAZ|nr:RPM1-interacting protein 4-like [Melia azedarach]
MGINNEYYVQYQSAIVSRSGKLFESSLVLERGRSLPKFGEWDVKNPASAEGFTMIFNKARDERKTNGSAGKHLPPRRSESMYKNNRSESMYKNSQSYQYPRKRKWLCCG